MDPPWAATTVSYIISSRTVSLMAATSSRHATEHRRPSSRSSIDQARERSDRPRRQERDVPPVPPFPTAPVASSSRNKITTNQIVHDRNGKLPEREINIRVEVGAGEDEPQQVEERLLDGVPLEIQEAWICEDLMFALQVRTSCGYQKIAACTYGRAWRAS